jgi:3-methyladenine DNA glycosylase Mpg
VSGDLTLRIVPATVHVDVGTSVRIGLTKATAECARYYARGSPYSSGPRALSPP